MKRCSFHSTAFHGISEAGRWPLPWFPIQFIRSKQTKLSLYDPQQRQLKVQGQKAALLGFCPIVLLESRARNLWTQLANYWIEMLANLCLEQSLASHQCPSFIVPHHSLTGSCQVQEDVIRSKEAVKTNGMSKSRRSSISSAPAKANGKVIWR